MPLDITRPYFALLLIPVLAVIGWYFYRSLSDFPKPQRWFSLAVRSLIVLLIVMALLGLHWTRSTDKLFVVFAVDVSESVGDEGRSTIEQFLKGVDEAKGPNQIAWMPFARSPEVISQEITSPQIHSQTSTTPNAADLPQLHEIAELAPSIILDDSTNPTQLISEKNATDIASAIEAATGFIPPGYIPRIVLLSDGNETLGDAIATATRSAVPIYTVPLPTSSTPEVQVASVKVPAEVQEGEPFFVDVTIQSNHDDEGTIEVFRGDYKVLSETKKLVVGENKFRFQQSMDRDRLAVYSARISGMQQDTLLDNNMDSGLVFASGKPRVLLIESDPDLVRELAYALEDEGIQVDVRPPQGMPESLSDLQNYECIILSNVPATALTTEQMQVAKTYVQDLGGGLMMLGGEQSFGLGGYYKSSLEEVLPVRSDFEKEKEKQSLALALVIDKSGSMGGERIELAKSAAAGAVELLGKKDYVGVVAFDGAPFIVSPMQQASYRAQIASQISSIQADGGTNMYPAMVAAYEMLNDVPARLKHAILLTDGHSSPSDFEGLAMQMVAAKMTVSTVAVGGDSDTTLMETIAKSGNGRFYNAIDASTVPQIFAKETVTASKSAIDESPFIAQTLRATHALRDIDLDNSPFLLGYVKTKPKPTAEVILVSEQGEPLLAWWRYGLGMSTAFTSDAKARWATEWLTWEGYGKFWTQVVRQTMRKNQTKGIQVAVERKDEMAHIEVDTITEAGFYLNDMNVEVTLIDPDLKQSKISLSQTAPGKYAADFSTLRPGAYHIDVAVKNGESVIYRQSRGIMIGYSDELRIKPTNRNLLESIASVSNGESISEVRQAFESGELQTTRPIPLWPWLLTAAAVLFLFDVALRRVDFSGYATP